MAQAHPPVPRETPRSDPPRDAAQATPVPATVTQTAAPLPLFRDLASI